MTAAHALLLGALQGFTEFLPISSSGHLVVAQKLLGFSHPPVAFDVFVHCGTLLAVVLFFRRRLCRFFLRFSNLKLLFVASLPAAFVGLFLNSFTSSLIF